MDYSYYTKYDDVIYAVGDCPAYVKDRLKKLYNLVTLYNTPKNNHSDGFYIFLTTSTGEIFRIHGYSVRCAIEAFKKRYETRFSFNVKTHSVINI